MNPPAPDPSSTASAPASLPWRSALMTLIASRFALVEIESRALVRAAATRLLQCVVAIVCGFLGWALLLTGAIALLARTQGWPWPWLVVGAAGMHLLAAVVLLKRAARPAAPAFSATRAEFQKDRAWIETFQKTPKS